MATKIGDLYFEVTADTSGARRDIARVGSAASEAAQIIGGVLVASLGSVALTAATGAALVTREIIGLGAAFNTASQSAYALFTALTGSLDDATTLMREFAQLSLDSPIFDVGQLQRTQSLLLTFGIANEQAFDLAQNINIAAIALDRGTVGAQQLARAIGQIQGRGWLEGDEARQLSEVGINAYQAIADAAGLTVAEVMKLGREHKLLAEDVIPILARQLETTFGPVGQNLLNTYGVQVQGIKNLFTGIGSALVEPFIGRAGGGALTDFLSRVRDELSDVVAVAEDGSFRLTGALEPLGELSQAIADGFASIGESLLTTVGGIDGSALEEMLTNAAAAVPDVVEDIKDFASATAVFFRDVFTAVQPAIPVIREAVGTLIDFAVEAVPILAEILVDVLRASAPIAAQFGEITNAIMDMASPVILDLLRAIADAMEIIADLAEVLAPLIDDLVLAWIGWKVALVAADIETATFVSVTLSPLLATLAAVAPAVTTALAALGAFQALKAGVTGDMDFVNRDVPFYAEPFKLAARYGFALGGGDEDQLRRTEEVETATQAYRDFNMELVAGAESFDEAREAATLYAQSLGLSEEGVLHFANQVAIAWKADADAAVQARIETEKLVQEYERWGGFGGVPLEGPVTLTGIEEEAIDLMRELTSAARYARAALDDFFRADEGATIDDFFRSLPEAVRDLTDAMAAPAGMLRDLEIGGVLQDVSDDAGKVIQYLVKEYGMGLGEIEAMFDERGLAGLIEILGNVTEETTETVDPLIAKYAQLGATADQLRDAIGRLEDERQERLRGQIDSVQDALTSAREAAVEAREAVRDFLSGGYLDSPQELIDDLVGDIGSIGSRIEDALRQGGVRGEAAIRGALADVQGQIADIVSAGLESGLSGEQIVGMLAPVLTALDEETRDARNRISSLDWSEGFTPVASQTITSMLSGILDPGAIQSLLNGITGADANVLGLERRLADLQAQAQVEVEFSPAQVQAALDEIRTTTMTEVVTTPEAAQAIYDEIQRLFDDKDLEARVDKDVIANDILEAAREVERSLTLAFTSGLDFDSDWIREAAHGVSEEFFEAFNAKMRALADARAQEQGFASVYDMERSLGPVVTGAVLGGSVYTTNINQDIQVNGAQSPTATASELVAASSAAAGSGGAYDPSKYYNRVGTYNPRLS